MIVAILDTGVDPNHPDLRGKLTPGWNFYDNNPDSSDVYGHGTKVAGTVAAMENNSEGVASVCWNCLILPVRVSRPDGYTSFSTIASALTWSADNGARVANISYQVSTSSTVTSAANYFSNKGGVVVSSAGNQGAVLTNPDNQYIVTVGATDESDALYSWSNTGSIVDLAAPGCAVTTVAGGGYGTGCGTSYSSPIAAGVAALVMSMNPALKPAEVVDILKKSADDRGPSGWDPGFGWGRINAEKAVALVSVSRQTTDTTPPTAQITSPANGATISGKITVQVAAGDNVGVTSVSLFVDGALNGTLATAPYNFTLDTTRLANGPRVIEARALDAAGNRASASITVNVNNKNPKRN